jgi:hypothetical protein
MGMIKVTGTMGAGAPLGMVWRVLLGHLLHL